MPPIRFWYVSTEKNFKWTTHHYQNVHNLYRFHWKKYNNKTLNMLLKAPHTVSIWWCLFSEPLSFTCLCRCTLLPWCHTQQTVGIHQSEGMYRRYAAWRWESSNELSLFMAFGSHFISHTIFRSATIFTFWNRKVRNHAGEKQLLAVAWEQCIVWGWNSTLKIQWLIFWPGCKNR